MSILRLPSYWSGMGYTAKAGYLVDTKQARDFSHACSLLNGLKKRKPKPVPPQQRRLPYAD